MWLNSITDWNLYFYSVHGEYEDKTGWIQAKLLSVWQVDLMTKVKVWKLNMHLKDKKAVASSFDHSQKKKKKRSSPAQQRGAL